MFIRELISNASDALEKLRYMQMQGEEIVDKGLPLEIHIEVDDSKKTFTIQVCRLCISIINSFKVNINKLTFFGSNRFMSRNCFSF